MKPYYQDQSVTIYHGDCRQIVPQLGNFDLLLTDPPYGIKANKIRGDTGKNKHIKQRDYGDRGDWDDSTVSQWVLQMARDSCVHQIIFGGNYYKLPPTSCWLVWDKLNGENLYADCELAWTNLKKAVRKKAHLWHGMLRKNNEQRWHPTQKPVEIMQWCINLAGDVQTILDPFAGSGTTGRAAKDLGKQAVLVEMDEQYCEIAAQRMAQEVLL
jgi:DNA modification methylase